PLASLYEGEVDAFARETAEAVAADAVELDRRITDAADDWTADRLGAIERNILRIALHELDGAEVPDEVAINEAVTLGKRYALVGGKRVRAVICLATAEAAGVEAEAALPAAASLELVHAFSLVHDDLPALDNDAARRGRASVWAEYGEAIAVLAGDTLLAEA